MGNTSAWAATCLNLGTATWSLMPPEMSPHFNTVMPQAGLWGTHPRGPEECWHTGQSWGFILSLAFIFSSSYLQICNFMLPPQTATSTSIKWREGNPNHFPSLYLARYTFKKLIVTIILLMVLDPYFINRNIQGNKFKKRCLLSAVQDRLTIIEINTFRDFKSALINRNYSLQPVFILFQKMQKSVDSFCNI